MTRLNESLFLDIHEDALKTRERISVYPCDSHEIDWQLHFFSASPKLVPLHLNSENTGARITRSDDLRFLSKMAEAISHDEYEHYQESLQYVDVHIEKEHNEEIQERLGHHSGPFPYTEILRFGYGHSQINSQWHDDHR